MSTTDETIGLLLASLDGAVQVVRADRDHVSVQLASYSGSGVRDELAASRLLCGAVTDERARHTRHIQIAIDGAAPSAPIYLGAMRARIGTDVRSITMRRAGSSVMVDLHLMPPAREPGVRAPVEGAAQTTGGSDQPRPVVGTHA